MTNEKSIAIVTIVIFAVFIVAVYQTDITLAQKIAVVCGVWLMMPTIGR